MIINKTNIKIDHFYNAKVFPNVYQYNRNIREEKFGHLEKAAQLVQGAGAVCEFGVHKGKSLKILGEAFPEDIVWGFDSFEGLPEDWNTGGEFNKDGIIKKEHMFN